jgi:hypothetical protein
MQQALNWMKNNVLAVVCLTVIVLSLASLYWPTHVHSSAFRADVAKRESQLAELARYAATPVVIPPVNPDDPPQQTPIVINQAAIDKLENVYKSLEREYTDIYDAAQKQNFGQHQPMLAGLFPRPIDQGTMFVARESYVRAFAQLYRSLKAGPAPSTAQIQSLMQREEETMRRSYLIPAATPLNPSQQAELLRRQADKVFELYRRTATEYHVYADPITIDPNTQDWTSAGVFQLAPWARPGRRPEMFDIWEGQMQLWIQQDLCHAIALANDVANEQTSLVELPVKRILSMVVKPGYVGAPEKGYTWPTTGAVTPEIAKTRIDEIQQQLKTRLPDNFTLSPTGRLSNPIYDVRHAVLSVIVDSQKIPALLNAIAKVNFMTVIGMRVVDVDEYAALRQGFYYGPCDAVQLDLSIESIWLRSWTAGHLSPELAAERNERFYEGIMPDEVRYFLGLPPRNADFAPRTAGSTGSQPTINDPFGTFR